MTTICQEDVLRMPNWNMRRIRLFYPVPDSYAPNPNGAMFRQMKLFSVEKLRQIEMSPEFQTDVQRCRKQCAKTAGNR
jgi:hypothetical protein